MHRVKISMKLMTLLAAMALLVGGAGAQANPVDPIDPGSIRTPDITRTPIKAPRADKSTFIVGPGQTYETIQAAVDVAAPGDEIEVLAGEYYESVAIVTSGLTISGPNAGIDPNTGTRVAEAIIYPTNYYAVYVAGGNVVIDGFIIDGDNPTLTSGLVINGADIDSEYGIYAANIEADGPVTVANNIIINQGTWGFLGYVGAGAVSSGNVVRNNYFDNIEYNTTYAGSGRSIIPLWSYYASVIDNVIERCSIGIYAENGSLAAATAPTISGNTVYSKRAGIWYNLQYNAAPAFTFTNNDLYVEDNPTGTRWYGVWLTSLGSASTTIDPVITDNRIHGAAVTQQTSGYHLWNNPTPSGITVTGGTVDGVDMGLWVNNWVGYNSNGGDTHMIVDGVAISNVDIAVYIQDDAQNTSGSVISGDVLAGTTITGAAIDVKVEGTDVAFNVDASLAPVSWAVSGGSIQDMIDAAFAGDSIQLAAETFNPTATVNVDKPLTLRGAGSGLTTIDVGGYDAWGIYVEASDITLEGFTVQGNAATNAQYGVHADPGITNLTYTDLQVQDTHRTALDLNGVDGATLTDIEVSGAAAGFGFAISSSRNVTINNLTSTGNAWGSVGVFPANLPYQLPGLEEPTAITFSGTLDLDGGDGSISVQDGALASGGTWTGTISNNPADGADVTVPTGFSHVVNSTRSPDGLVLHNVGPQAAIHATAQALAAATTPFTFSGTYIVDLDNGDLEVIEGLLIQDAIDAASAGGVVNVEAGTYDDNLTFAKSLAINGPNATLSPNTDTRVAEAVLMPSGGAAITGNTNDIDVVIKGLTVDMGNTAEGDRFMNQTGRTGTTWTFEHNIFQNASSSDSGHWLLNGANVGLVFTLTDNLFTGNDVSNGIAIWDVNGFTIDVQNNVWENNEYTAMNLNRAQGVISNNIFRDTRTIDLNDPDYQWYNFQSGMLLANDNFDLEISGNVFQNIQYGVSMYANVDGPIEIIDNVFDGVTIAAVRASDSQAVPGDLADVVVSGNEFNSYVGTGFAVWNARADEAPLTATGNWWGSSSGPYNATNNPTGTGVAVSDFVLFYPWVGLPSASIGVTNTLINCDGTVTATVSLTVDENTEPVFLFATTMRASAELDWSDPQLVDPDLFGEDTIFMFEDMEDGSFEISGTSTGGSPSYIDAPGIYPLFTVVFAAASDGVAEITFDSFIMRNPDNQTTPVLFGSQQVTVDCTAPAAVTGITATPAHNKVNVSWTHDGSTVDHFEVYRAVWYDGTLGGSAYPEYDDLANDVIPARPLNRAAAATSDVWVLVDDEVDAGTTAIIDASMADDRGVYYYEVYAVDLAANASPNAPANDRATSYWLGDFSGDGIITPAADINTLADAFGTSEGHDSYNPNTDVGPTDDASRLGIPTTDNSIDFEDLMITALNFGVVTNTKSDVTISDSVHLAWVQYSETRWALRLLDGQGLQGVRVRTSLPEGGAITVTAGDLLDSQSGAHFLRAVGDAVDINLALLGTGTSFVGEGDLFVVDANVALAAEQLTIDARNLDNGGMTVELAQLTDVDLPEVFSLNANYPNPFNPATTIRFALPEGQPVRLTIYGIDGRMVATLVNGDFPAGSHEVTWHGRDAAGRLVASGTYMYRIDAGPYSAVRKMTLMK